MSKKAKAKRAPRFDGLLEDQTIERDYRGLKHMVVVKDCRLEYAGKTWRSLTAIARAITGYKAISGPAFFKIGKKQEATQCQKS